MSEKIKNLVNRYLRGEIQLRDFQQQFAGFYFQVRKNRNSDRTASKLCDEIVGPLAELSRGHRSEVSFREELAHGGRPFRSLSLVVWKSPHLDKTSDPREIRSVTIGRLFDISSLPGSYSSEPSRMRP